jgi:uracil-DNA glycosylase
VNKRTKLRKLRALAIKRKRSRLVGYKGTYKRLRDYKKGRYECDFVSPYTKTAGNVDSEIMVMLQDWTSTEAIRRRLSLEVERYGFYPNLPTNRNLKQLLQTHFHRCLDDIYATNLFPFIKMGQISEKIPVCDLVLAAKEYGCPQIEIINPKLVICLGLVTFNALRIACGKDPLDSLSSAIDNPFMLDDARIWCQAHTGAWGQNQRNRKRDQVKKDWQRMKTDLARRK